mmetsp:Transcript_3990/g.13201  ORF Transcript_3990/g.13201 Transcript_3990/m.13201 type:complete len:200 (+) Transcript_3990:96-695(+)
MSGMGTVLARGAGIGLLLTERVRESSLREIANIQEVMPPRPGGRAAATPLSHRSGIHRQFHSAVPSRLITAAPARTTSSHPQPRSRRPRPPTRRPAGKGPFRARRRLFRARRRLRVARRGLFRARRGRSRTVGWRELGRQRAWLERTRKCRSVAVDGSGRAADQVERSSCGTASPPLDSIRGLQPSPLFARTIAGCNTR